MKRKQKTEKEEEDGRLLAAIDISIYTFAHNSFSSRLFGLGWGNVPILLLISSHYHNNISFTNARSFAGSFLTDTLKIYRLCNNRRKLNRMYYVSVV